MSARTYCGVIVKGTLRRVSQKASSHQRVTCGRTVSLYGRCSHSVSSLRRGGPTRLKKTSHPSASVLAIS